MPSHVLSCWKEIAAYLGKGVRTVQRWEKELGLPVRRPDNIHKHVVLAVQDEIDEWVRTQVVRVATKDAGEITSLREKLKVLEAENQKLRKRPQRSALKHAQSTREKR